MGKVPTIKKNLIKEVIIKEATYFVEEFLLKRKIRNFSFSRNHELLLNCRNFKSKLIGAYGYSYNFCEYIPKYNKTLYYLDDININYSHRNLGDVFEVKLRCLPFNIKHFSNDRFNMDKDTFIELLSTTKNLLYLQYINKKIQSIEQNSNLINKSYESEFYFNW